MRTILTEEQSAALQYRPNSGVLKRADALLECCADAYNYLDEIECPSDLDEAAEHWEKAKEALLRGLAGG